MSPSPSMQFDEYVSDEAATGRSGKHVPARMHRRKTSRRTAVRARRRRTSEAATKGIHRRRNKRAFW